MKKFIIIFITFLICFPAISIARKDTGPPEWTFDNAADLADWRDFHDLSSLTTVKVKTPNGIERNVLKIVPTGDNPYVYPGGSVPSWEPFNGYEHKYIYMSVRIDRTDIWQIEYTTSRTGDFSEGQSRKFVINGSQDFQELKLDMQWDGMIRGFRIRLGTNKNKTIEIDYLSLRGPITTSQTPRKLSTTWGKVKDLF